jgi:hypothetical protein
MTEGDTSPEKKGKGGNVHARFDSVSGSSDGAIHLQGEAVGSADVSKDEARERIADGLGIPADDVAIGHDEVGGQGRRGSVGFTTWNSPWNPGEEVEIDPTQN